VAQIDFSFSHVRLAAGGGPFSLPFLGVALTYLSSIAAMFPRFPGGDVFSPPKTFFFFFCIEF